MAVVLEEVDERWLLGVEGVIFHLVKTRKWAVVEMVEVGIAMEASV